MAEKRYSDFIRLSKQSNEYWTETAITDFTEELCRLMDQKGVSRADLAQRIGHSQAYVTKVLRGNVNFTLATMTKLARALGTIVRIHLAPDGVIVEWVDRPAEQPIAVVYAQERNIKSPSQRTTISAYTTATFDESVQTAIGMN